jgi:hypothetical protein
MKQVDETSWQNSKLMKHQFDETACCRNSMLMKQQVDKNSKFMKQTDDETAS